MRNSRRPVGWFLIALGALPLLKGLFVFAQYFSTGELQWQWRGQVYLVGSDALVPYAVCFLVGAAMVGKGVQRVSDERRSQIW